MTKPPIRVTSFPTQVLQDLVVTTGGVKYKYLTLQYNTVTRSGYDVERIAYVAATVRQHKLLSLVATVSSQRLKKMALDLDAIRSSFRLGGIGTSDVLPVDSDKIE